MSLWGNKDYATGNNKPVYANTTYVVSNSTINGSKANTAKYYGAVWGVSATEQANTLARADGTHPQHSGWVSQKIGTGPVASIAIANNGTGINAAGFLIASGGGGTGLNVSYTTANSQNLLQSSSTNPAWNVVATVVINNAGAGYNTAPTLVYNGANTIRPQFTVTVGGRAGRVQYETLVAMGSITEDNTADNIYFPGT